MCKSPREKRNKDLNLFDKPRDPGKIFKFCMDKFKKNTKLSLISIKEFKNTLLGTKLD